MKDPEEAKITIVLPICVVVLAAAAYGLFGKCKTASKQRRLSHRDASMPAVSLETPTSTN